MKKTQIDSKVHEIIDFQDDVEICKYTDEYISYVVKHRDFSSVRKFWYPVQSAKDLRKRIIYDEKVRKYVNCDKLCKFLYQYADENELMVCNGILLGWFEEAGKQDGKIIAENLGIFKNIADTMYDKQIIVVNVKHLLNAGAVDMLHMPCIDECVNDDEKNELRQLFQKMFAEEIFAELRRLLYRCNDLVDFGTGKYPAEGGLDASIRYYASNKVRSVNWKETNFINF